MYFFIVSAFAASPDNILINYRQLFAECEQGSPGGKLTNHYHEVLRIRISGSRTPLLHKVK
jgi:hypothetical protein